MIDFPNNPSNGQIFYSGTNSWIYNDGQWSKRTGYVDTIGQLKDVELTNVQSNDQLVWSMDKFVNQPTPAPSVSEQNKNYPSNRYVFKVNNSKTTCADSVETIIKFDQVQFDPSNVFDEVNYKFVAPVDGYYKIGVSVYYVTTYTAANCYVYVDGVKFGTMFGFTNKADQGGNFLSKSTVMKLNQNQTVSMYFNIFKFDAQPTFYHSYDIPPHVDTEFYGYLYRKV